MKIKNDYVKIIIDGKSYEFKNLILDEYLNLIASKQCIGDYETFPSLTKCWIRLDKKLEFDERSELTTSDFNFSLTGTFKVTEKASNKVVIEYSYDEEIPESLKGRQITTIGFFNEDNLYCCACINTYAFGLKLDTGIKIFRKDIVGTDALFSSDLIWDLESPCPIHLLPEPLKLYFRGGDYVQLESYLTYIGLGTKSTIYTGFVLSDNNRICSENKVIIRDARLKNLHSYGILEPGYRMPGSGLYPTSINQAYIYIHFVYRVKDIDSDWDFGEYKLSMPIDIIGDTFEYAVEYERSE